MLSEFEEAKKLIKLNVGDKRDNVERCELRSITHGDAYVHTLRIIYMDKKEEKFIIPPGEMILSDVQNKEGMETTISNFPIQKFEEIATSTHVMPYIDLTTKKPRPSKIELTKVESPFHIFSIRYSPDF